MSSNHDDRVSPYHSDCLGVVITLDDNSIDAVVADPPNALDFRGHDWDTEHPNHAWPTDKKPLLSARLCCVAASYAPISDFA